MPAHIAILTDEGLLDAPYQADSLADAARYEPDDGVYTVTNTYHATRTLKLDAHLDRLEDSARRAGIALQLDRQRLRAGLRKMILAAGWGDVRFRVTVPRAQPDQLILTIEPFAPLSPALIAHGVACVTQADSARHNPEIKSTGWMHDRQALADAMPAGVYETLLLDADHHLLEGLSTNFYAIRDGQLFTATAGVLAGISRQIVFEVAPPLPIVTEPVTYDALPQLQEAFITSSSRGIVPVVRIDAQVIGDGQPGSITRQLRAAYDAWVQDHLREL